MDNIVTNRLHLTLFNIADTGFLKTLFSFADIRKYYVLRHDHALDITLFANYILNAFQQHKSLNYIVRLQDGTPIGLVGGELYQEHTTGVVAWNVSYAILPSYRRNGYATEAVIAFTEQIKKFNIGKAFLDISDNNEFSKKVAVKAGYKYNKDTAHFDPEHMDLDILFHWEMMLHSSRDAYFSMACSAFQTKKYREAEDLFQKALECPREAGSPNTNALCYSNMGIACSSYGNYQKAFQCLKKAQSLGLTNASIEKELTWLKNNVGLF